MEGLPGTLVLASWTGALGPSAVLQGQEKCALTRRCAVLKESEGLLQGHMDTAALIGEILYVPRGAKARQERTGAARQTRTAMT
jgi:hypothetical protein